MRALREGADVVRRRPTRGQADPSNWLDLSCGGCGRTVKRQEGGLSVGDDEGARSQELARRPTCCPTTSGRGEGSDVVTDRDAQRRDLLRIAATSIAEAIRISDEDHEAGLVAAMSDARNALAAAERQLDR